MTILLIPLLYLISFIIPSIVRFSAESIINDLTKFVIAIAVGVLFGLILIAIKRKHAIILITSATCAFIISESFTKMGLLTVVACAILYHNIIEHREINPKEKQKEEKDIHRISMLFGIVASLFLAYYFYKSFSFAAVLITAVIVMIRIVFKEKNFTASFIPLTAMFCIGRIFPEINPAIGLVGTITLYLLVISVVININDITQRIKNIIKNE